MAESVEPVEFLVNNGEDDESVRADVEEPPYPLELSFSFEPSCPFGPSCLNVSESWRWWSFVTLEMRGIGSPSA